MHQVLEAGFIVCRFDLDKMFSELVAVWHLTVIVTCHLAQMTITLTLTAVLSLPFLWGTYVS